MLTKERRDDLRREAMADRGKAYWPDIDLSVLDVLDALDKALAEQEQEREEKCAISVEHRAKAARIAERLIDEMDRVTSDPALLPQMPGEVYQLFADAIHKLDLVSRGRGAR